MPQLSRCCLLDELEPNDPLTFDGALQLADEIGFADARQHNISDDDCRRQRARDRAWVVREHRRRVREFLAEKRREIDELKGDGPQ